MKKIAILSIVVFLLIGCKIIKTNDVGTSDLVNHRFELIFYNNEDITSTVIPTAFIQFDNEMKVNGKMCSQFYSENPANLINDILSVTTYVSTRIYCPNEIYNKLDIVINKLLKAGIKVNYQDNLLILTDNLDMLIFKQS